ncbi:hypothetical protein J4D99_15990 [Siccationidurans ginsengisoli]|nr:MULTISPECIES: hypothetical protein [unclassified Hymenobacter]MBO2032898.1 hypothetical protein [Hymenobacter sp. BT559]
MKYALLVAALLLMLATGRQAMAQRAPLPAQLIKDRSVAAPLDSAAVLHQLFKHSRRLGLLGLTASTGMTNGINALNDPRWGRQLLGGVSVGTSTGLLVIMLVDNLKFSRRREREAIEQLQQHQPLRPYVPKNYSLALLKAALHR